MKTDLYKSLFDSINSAIIIATRDKILDTNKAFLDIVKISEKAELLSDSFYNNIIRGIVTGEIKDCIDITDKKGTPILVGISLSLLDSEKNVYIVEFNRIDDSQLYDEITLLSLHNRELFNNSPDAIVILSNDSTVIDVNDAFEQVFEYTRYETIGRDIDDLIVNQPDRKAAKELFQRVLNKERMGITTQRLTKSRKSVDVQIVGYPVVIDNRISGNYIIYKDISSEIEKEKLLKEKEQFFSQLFNGSLFPIAILDKKERVLDVNQKFEQIFGFHRAEIINKRINKYIIPEEYSAESNMFREKIFNRETLITKTKRKVKSGELIDVEAVGSPVIIDDQVIGMFAMYRDIRSEVQMLNELKLEKAFFQQAFKNSPDPIVVLDMHDRVVDINHTFEKRFGYGLREARGAYINDLIVSEEYKEEAILNSQVLLTEGRPVHVETVRVSKCGAKIEVDVLAFPIILDEDQLGIYVIYRDISERKNKEREITKLIYLDSLTGLYNRKHAYESLSEKIKGALANKKKIAILYCDVDELKSVNDEKGHSAGDELLMKIAVRISDHFQGRMEISRIGGDEFLAIVTDQSTVSLEEYAEEMRQLFHKKFIVKDKLIKSDISIGYASYPEDGANVDQLIASADSRMYLEKKIKRIQKTPVRKTATLEELQKERDRD